MAVGAEQHQCLTPPTQRRGKLTTGEGRVPEAFVERSALAVGCVPLAHQAQRRR